MRIGRITRHSINAAYKSGRISAEKCMNLKKGMHQRANDWLDFINVLFMPIFLITAAALFIIGGIFILIGGSCIRDGQIIMRVGACFFAVSLPAVCYLRVKETDTEQTDDIGYVSDLQNIRKDIIRWIKTGSTEQYIYKIRDFESMIFMIKAVTDIQTLTFVSDNLAEEYLLHIGYSPKAAAETIKTFAENSGISISAADKTDNMAEDPLGIPARYREAIFSQLQQIADPNIFQAFADPAAKKKENE